MLSVCVCTIPEAKLLKCVMVQLDQIQYFIQRRMGQNTQDFPLHKI